MKYEFLDYLVIVGIAAAQVMVIGYSIVGLLA